MLRFPYVDFREQVYMDYQNKEIFHYIWWIAQIFGLLSICLVFTWTVQFLGGFAWHENPLHEFNYHPVFAVMGPVFLFGNGLLAYRSVHTHRKARLKILHISLLFLTFLFTVISLKTAFDSHNYRSPPIPNLYSLHSWIGLGTVILFSIQFCFAFLVLLYPGSDVVFRRSYMPFHQFFGITIFALSVVCCHSGIMEKAKASLEKEYKNLPPPAFTANFLGVSITIFAILVIFLVAMPQFQRSKSHSDEDELELQKPECTQWN